ncbi:hypothetical protein [Haloarcula laminariae]|uniref:hypothetical protein n=1 Tax=Haloarcula laminariae TaxID=2961577 RepID=UPI0024069996|nr:hypothetical protein [Halomicroarcula sp. FL173]
MNRRGLLCSFSIPAATSVGGCLGLDSVFNGSVTLGAVLLENRDPDSSHRFDVRVKRGGKTVHTGSYTVQSRPDEFIRTRFVDCTWREVDGNYSIVARVDDGTWGEYSILDGVDNKTDCAVGLVS